MFPVVKYDNSYDIISCHVITGTFHTICCDSSGMKYIVECVLRLEAHLVHDENVKVYSIFMFFIVIKIVMK